MQVAVIELEGTTILYQKHFPSDVYQGIISTQFEKVVLNGSEKNVLLIAVEDTSILALEEGLGLLLSTTAIRAKNPSRALFMQTLGKNYCLSVLVCILIRKLIIEIIGMLTKRIFVLIHRY